ncbi:PAS domain S-box protein, partial [Candidatus Bipolaricaulota bacterium]|nr:PAS domain S-box protein [Candidatus Bipolaricaulota bacterium]
MNDAKQEDSLRSSIIDSSPLPIFAIDAEDRVRYLWNDEAEGVFGWSKSQIVGRKLPMVPEENREEIKDLRKRSLRGETFRGVETRFQKENGDLIDVTISLAPLTEEGTDEAVLCIASDIQERQEMEITFKDSKNLYKKLFNRLNDAFFLSP